MTDALKISENKQGATKAARILDGLLRHPKGNEVSTYHMQAMREGFGYIPLRMAEHYAAANYKIVACQTINDVFPEMDTLGMSGLNYHEFQPQGKRRTIVPEFVLQQNPKTGAYYYERHTAVVQDTIHEMMHGIDNISAHIRGYFLRDHAGFVAAYAKDREGAKVTEFAARHYPARGIDRDALAHQQDIKGGIDEAIANHGVDLMMGQPVFNFMHGSYKRTWKEAQTIFRELGYLEEMSPRRNDGQVRSVSAASSVDANDNTRSGSIKDLLRRAKDCVDRKQAEVTVKQIVARRAKVKRAPMAPAAFRDLSLS